MRALVTGSAGFIGSHIVKLLPDEGHKVTILDNSLSEQDTYRAWTEGVLV